MKTKKIRVSAYYNLSPMCPVCEMAMFHSVISCAGPEFTGRRSIFTCINKDCGLNSRRYVAPVMELEQYDN